MIENKLKFVIRDIPNFPKEGIMFKDITPILLDSKLCTEVTATIYNKFKDENIGAVVGIESRGFLFGLPLAEKLNVPFIPIRKKGKLPGDTIAYSYDLEYGSSTVEIHSGDMPKGANVIIHDDLLATGGTAIAAAELVKQSGANVKAFAFLVELGFLDGRNKLEPYTKEIQSLVQY